MRVCHIVPSLEERHGGPSKSVRALANHVARTGDTVELLATEETPGSFTTAATDQAVIRAFPRITPRWLSRSPTLEQYLMTTPFDCVHHHALWLLPLRYAAAAARRHDAPLVISPRGMMSGWAYRHRRWRKHLAEFLVHPGAFAQAAGWHATSPEEAADIRALGFTQPVCVSPNGVTIPGETDLAAARAAWLQLCPGARSRPVALFYSRLHRKKRVRELIELWLSAPRGDWLLLIAGVTEEYSAAELAAEVTALGASEKIAVFDGTDRLPPYAVASLFVLPSHSENFGLVIAEALAAGVPALVTDTTPWSGLAANNCGWCVRWEEFGEALAIALATPRGELQSMGRRGIDWVTRDYSWAKAATLLHEFVHHLIHEHR